MHAAQDPCPAVLRPPGQDTQALIANCDARLARYQAALDAGADPKAVAEWTRQIQAERAAVPARAASQDQVQRWSLPEGWVISKRPAHAALISEADFIVAQDAAAPRGPAGPAVRRYLLACRRCGRRLESTWSNGKPAYRCRHGYTSAASPDPPGPATPTSAKTRSSRTWPLSASCSSALPGNRAAGFWRAWTGARPGQVRIDHRTARKTVAICAGS